LIGRVGRSWAGTPEVTISSTTAARPQAVFQIRLMRPPRAQLSAGPEYRICEVTLAS
jgi:hypothetical protein